MMDFYMENTLRILGVFECFDTVINVYYFMTTTGHICTKILTIEIINSWGNEILWYIMMLRMFCKHKNILNVKLVLISLMIPSSINRS